MRARFIRTLTELAADDPRIVLLTGDLGYTVIEPFADRFPDRFFNVGVAEQNMVGMATGLAEAGLIPFVYSIATFASLRPYEFIRNGPVLHQLPVRIVGVGGGVEYGHAGPTHHALEDVGVLRLQPGLAVLVPADADQAESALRASWDQPGPAYFRLGKDEVTIVPGLQGRFRAARIELVRDGSDLVMLAMGPVAAEAVAAADQLAALGVYCAVAVIASVSPPPVEDLVALLRRFPEAMTVEAHYTVGGVGSLVAEVIADHGLTCRVTRQGITGMGVGSTGSEAFLLARHGLTREALTTAVRQVVGGVAA